MLVKYSFLKVANSRPLLLYFRFFCALFVQLVDKILPMISNQGPLVSEETALQTEPPPLPG